MGVGIVGEELYRPKNALMKQKVNIKDKKVNKIDSLASRLADVG
jgi:hypothetical protein